MSSGNDERHQGMSKLLVCMWHPSIKRVGDVMGQSLGKREFLDGERPTQCKLWGMGLHIVGGNSKRIGDA